METNISDALENNETLDAYLGHVSTEDFRNDLKIYIKAEINKFFKESLDKIG